MATSLDVASDGKPRNGKRSPVAGPDMSMMRVAVAGTGGLARLIAYAIADQTSHHVVYLSRTTQPQLIALGYQVLVVDYSDADSLKFALRGIDTVISTVTGPNQLELIRAAVAARVRRFAPAEFEGLPALQNADGPLDRSRTAARRWLLYYSQHIQSTIFICGILYERFQPGGLLQSRIGLTSGFGGEGDYIMNCGNMTARIPAYDSSNDPNVTICMTAAQDVGRFVTKAIDMRQWPAEMSMQGLRIAVKDLVALVERMKGQRFNPAEWHNPASLRSALDVATAQQDQAGIIRLHTLIETAEGRYDFTTPTLNQMFPDVQPITFQRWFQAKWNSQR